MATPHLVPVDESSSEDDSVLETSQTQLGSAIRLVLIFASIFLVVVASLQSIETIWIRQPDVMVYSGVFLLTALTHLCCVTLISTVVWKSMLNKSRFIVGSLIASISTLAYASELLDLKFDDLWSMGFLRIGQEFGFSLILYSLPAISHDEMSTLSRIVLPMMNTVRGAAVFVGLPFNHWVTSFHRDAGFMCVSIGFLSMAVIASAIVDSSYDVFRRSFARPRILKFSWNVVMNTLIVFSNIFTLLMMILLVNEERTSNMNWSVLISAVIYLISGPGTAVLIRWLPSRGILYMISFSSTIAAILTLERFSKNNYVFQAALMIVSFSYGAQSTLLHMNLIETFARNVHGRYHVAAARVTAVCSSIGFVLASLAPVIFKGLDDQHLAVCKSLYPSLALNACMFMAVGVTMLVELLRE